MNTMVLVEINNSTFDEWKKSFDSLASFREQFSRNSKVGKIDEHTAVVITDVFDPQGMMSMFASDEAKKIAEEMGVTRTAYKLQSMG
jgi:hypothetical protein